MIMSMSKHEVNLVNGIASSRHQIEGSFDAIKPGVVSWDVASAVR